jgi:uncharacterized protein (TIGR04168 family)
VIAVAAIGDVHLHWDEDDRRWFDASDYDLLLFVGDLAGYRSAGLDVAQSIARCSKPSLVVPGNHDGANLLHLAAETLELKGLSQVLGKGKAARCTALSQALEPTALAGFSVHNFCFGAESLSVVAGRPHSQGASQLAFSSYLKSRFGIGSIEASAERLCERVEEAEHARLIFLAHCGPSGLGARRDDIWGCDFRASEGDFGDRDLAVAVAHAKAIGKQVVAVVAGHMHHRLKGGGYRRWKLERDATLYVNAARVPRHRRDGMRHHVRIEVDGTELRCSERWVDPAVSTI